VHPTCVGILTEDKIENYFSESSNSRDDTCVENSFPRKFHKIEVAALVIAIRPLVALYAGSSLSALSSSLYLRSFGHPFADSKPRDWAMVPLLFVEVDDAFLELELCLLFVTASGMPASQPLKRMKEPWLVSSMEHCCCILEEPRLAKPRVGVEVGVVVGNNSSKLRAHRHSHAHLHVELATTRHEPSVTQIV
jgi:hypothetical protein